MLILIHQGLVFLVDSVRVASKHSLYLKILVPLLVPLHATEVVWERFTRLILWIQRQLDMNVTKQFQVLEHWQVVSQVGVENSESESFCVGQQRVKKEAEEGGWRRNWA